jgi:hypothetical protein
MNPILEDVFPDQNYRFRSIQSMYAFMVIGVTINPPQKSFVQTYRWIMLLAFVVHFAWESQNILISIYDMLILQY